MQKTVPSLGTSSRVMVNGGRGVDSDNRPSPPAPPPPLFRGHPFLSLSLAFKVFSLYRWQLCPAIAAPDDKRFLIIFLFLNGSFLD